MTVENQYPVLVYGTLRPGGHNYAPFLGGKTESEERIRVRGFDMYGSARNGFPYVMFGDGVITADLVTLKPEMYVETMLGLDFLEGYNGKGHRNHYERKLVRITRDNGEKVNAWIYVIEGEDAKMVSENYEKTKMGDWLLQKSGSFA